MPVVNSPIVSTSPAISWRGEQLGIGHGHQRDRVVDVDALQAELLAIAAEGGRQDPPQETADAGRFVGQLVVKVEAEHDAVGDVQGDERLGRGGLEDGLAAAGSQIDVELGGRGDVARTGRPCPAL